MVAGPERLRARQVPASDDVRRPDRMHVDDPYYSSRTIFVDTTGFSSTDFHLKPADKMTLFDNGHTAASQFLSTWKYDKWRAANPARSPRPPVTAPSDVER